MVDNWWKSSGRWREPINQLPQLGHALLTALIENYGAESVAKAALCFVEIEDREHAHRQAKREAEFLEESFRSEFEKRIKNA